jgi:hypothetical protein
MKLARGDRPLARLLGVAAALAGLPAAAAFLHRSELLAPCPLRTLTGIPCLTCGATRSLTALAQGDVAAALTASPVTVLGVVLVAAWALASLVMTVWPATRRRLELSRGERRVTVWLVAGLVLANWVWLVTR